ncbi:MAG: LacI family DNA-binding transcriptional regulator [Anaerolineae bacterium]|nr:LacI family DNA-binding transcriptional regulator [Anaerolineae bacterium]
MTVRLQDIAQQLNLSVTTVSLALRDSPRISEQTRALVRSTATSMGYVTRIRAARGVDMRHIVFVALYDIDDVFYGEVLRAAENECRQSGMTLHFTQLEGEVTPADFDRYGSESGLLLVGSIPEAAIRALREPGRPIVLVDNNLPHLGLDRVLTENFGGVYGAAARLVELGHRRIAYIDGFDQPSFRERRAGYRQAMRDFGLEMVEIQPQDKDEMYGNALIDRSLDTLREKQVTALVTCQDLAAIYAINALHSHGIQTPADISVVGFDGIAMGGMMRPALTTVGVNRQWMGETAVRRLLDRAADPAAPSQAIVLDTAWIERDTLRPLA